MLKIQKILNKCYIYIKNIIKFIKIKILKINIKNKYNLKKIQKHNLQNKECIFCLDELINENINYKCKYCTISFHEKCFKKYLRNTKYLSCIQCRR